MIQTVAVAAVAQIPTFSGDLVVVHPLGLAFLLGGLYTIYRGHQSRERAQRVAEQDPEPVSGLRPGVVEVFGEARPVENDRTVPAHLTGYDALVSEFVLERKSGGGNNTEMSFSPHWTDLRRVPFEVDDGTGTVRVEVPPDASFVHEDDYERPSRLSGRVPDDVERLLEGEPGVDPPNSSLWSNTYNWRWKTGAVYPGETVYVRGRAVDAVTEWGETNVEIAGGEDLEEFIVSDMDESGVIAKRTEKAKQYYATGGLLAVIGVAFMFRPVLVVLAG